MNNFIFRFERFQEGPEGVPGACSAAKVAPEEVPGAVSGSKAEPKGGKNGSIDFFLGPLGALPGLRGPLTHNKGSTVGRPGSRERGPRVPGGIKGGNKQGRKNKQDLSRRWAVGPANLFFFFT